MSRYAGNSRWNTKLGTEVGNQESFEFGQTRQAIEKHSGYKLQPYRHNQDEITSYIREPLNKNTTHVAAAVVEDEAAGYLDVRQHTRCNDHLRHPFTVPLPTSLSISIWPPGLAERSTRSSNFNDAGIIPKSSRTMTSRAASSSSSEPMS